MLKKKFFNANNILFCIELVLLFVLMMLFVPTCDDLQFGNADFFQFNNFKELIHAGIYYGNGRLLGNIFAVFFSKYPQLFYAFEYVLIILFCSMIEKLIEFKNIRHLVMASVIFLPIFVFRGTIAWISAAINYFIPIFLLVLSLLILKKCAKADNKGLLSFYCVVLMFIGISEQLFIEHNAGANVLISMLIVAYLIYKKKANKKNLIPAVILLISNLIGAALLLLYGFYINYEDTYCSIILPENNYRTTVLDMESIKYVITFIGKNASYFILTISASFVIYSVFFITMLYIEKKAKTKNIKNIKIVTALCIAYYPLCILSNILVAFQVENGDFSKLYFLLIGFLGLLSLIGMAVLFYASVIKRADKKLTASVILLMALSIISFAPFLLVSPCAYRSCLFSYLLLMVASALVLKFATEKYGLNIEKFYKPVVIACCVVISIYIGFYSREKQIYNYRINYVGTTQYLPKGNANFVCAYNCMWEYVDDTYDEYEYIPLDEWKEIINSD